MKSEKGHYGYVRHEKVRRLIRTVVIFAIDFGIFAFGMYMNQGDRRNIYSVIAAVGCIPGAMSAVGFITMALRHPVKKELYEDIVPYTRGLEVLYELYITTRDISLFLDATIITDEYVTALCTENRPQRDVAFIEDHIRKYLLADGIRVTVKIFTNEKNFLERAERLSEKAGMQDPDRIRLVSTAVKRLAL